MFGPIGLLPFKILRKEIKALLAVAAGFNGEGEVSHFKVRTTPNCLCQSWPRAGSEQPQADVDSSFRPVKFLRRTVQEQSQPPQWRLVAGIKAEFGCLCRTYMRPVEDRSRTLRSPNYYLHPERFLFNLPWRHTMDSDALKFARRS